MRQGQTLKYWIIFFILIQSVQNFEIFIGKTRDINNENVEQLGSRQNKSYEIHLFQTRYITVRIHPNDLRRTGINHSHVVGFKFQVRTSRENIVEIKKELDISTDDKKIKDADPVIAEDLFICEYSRQ